MEMMISLLQKFKPLLLFLITIFVLNFGFITCQSSWHFHQCLDKFDTSASYQSYVQSLMDSLSSKSSLNTFYNDSFNGIYGLFLCRGDVNRSRCQTRVNEAAQFLPKNCSSSYLGAVIWYEECLLRYSDTNFYGEMRFVPHYYMPNRQNITSPGENLEVLGWLSDLSEQAQNSRMLFEAQQKNLPSDVSQHRYVLVQCSRDLNSSSCYTCLKKITNEIRNCCQWTAGWRFLTPSCIARYEKYPFFQMESATPQHVPTVPGPMHNKGGRTNEEIVLRNSQGPNQRHIVEAGVNEAVEEHSGEMHYFSLAEIQAATNDFSDANKLGEGVFGPVYKGKMHNGREVAVKRLSMTSNQGVQEFKNEVKLIIKLQHKNLVRLLGYSLEEDEKLLVYEYMANNSFDAFLFDSTKCKLLDWETRANIINGTAKGLQYLHEDSRLKIIHRDLKASNILLDDEMNPKISDFGTARNFGVKQTEANTEKVVGTCGYMAPEYALEGLISVKSDVYSFGILMLEIISGKKNRGLSKSDCGQNLLAYAWMLWSEGKAVELIDPNIVNSCPRQDVLRWVQIALLCVQDDPAHRPTMSSVVIMLGSISINLPQPSAAPYSAARFLASSDNSSSSGGNIGSRISDQSSTPTDT